jgi:predicted enzyme related to lactoylglutathione lyase
VGVGIEQRAGDGGIYQNEEDGPSWLVLYITVDDVDSMAAKIEQQGGRIVQPPFDVEGLGRLCLFEEPSGQRLAIIKRVF